MELVTLKQKLKVNVDYGKPLTQGFEEHTKGSEFSEGLHDENVQLAIKNKYVDG